MVTINAISFSRKVTESDWTRQTRLSSSHQNKAQWHIDSVCYEHQSFSKEPFWYSTGSVGILWNATQQWYVSL